jgi:hypothetical protein
LPFQVGKVKKTLKFYKANEFESGYKRQNPLEMLVIWRSYE